MLCRGWRVLCKGWGGAMYGAGRMHCRGAVRVVCRGWRLLCRGGGGSVGAGIVPCLVLKSAMYGAGECSVWGWENALHGAGRV